MVSVVRNSKYRHVFGEELKVKFEEVRSTALASEGTLVVSNGKYAAFCWETSGPGILAVLNLKEETGRIPASHPWIRGHTANITDFEFNPFNENEIATGCDDAHIRLWRLNQERITEDLISPLTTLSGHSKKVSLLNFHPSAAYILASASHDKTVKVWNVERSEVALSYDGLSDNATSLQWSPHGRQIGVTTRDKLVRGVDPRHKSHHFEFRAHEGAKPSKLTWIDEHTLITCGFSATADRQIAVWDLKNHSQPIKLINLDQGSGVLYPFYDPDTTCLFVGGKGDGTIRFYEVTRENEYMYFLGTFQSNVPCRGVSFIPKHAVDTNVCEIMRAVKLTNNTVDQISFRVPRKSEAFQDDIYPDCLANSPAMTAEQWLEGHNKDPVRVPIRNVGTSVVNVQIKAAKTPAEYEHELKEAHEEIERLRRRIRELEARG
jgi:WD40 repeat protein